MKKVYDYMDDKELEALIAEVENGGMIAPPIYLKELIMKEARQEREACEEPLELSAVDSAGSAAVRKEAVRKEAVRAAKVQFWIYSLKIAAAAAAAVFCLITMPADLSGGSLMENDRMEDNRIEKRIEEDAERYQQEKRKALEGEENAGKRMGGFFDGLSGHGSLEGVNGLLNGFSNWFGMEEKNYD